MRYKKTGANKLTPESGEWRGSNPRPLDPQTSALTD